MANPRAKGKKKATKKTNNKRQQSQESTRLGDSSQEGMTTAAEESQETATQTSTFLDEETQEHYQSQNTQDQSQTQDTRAEEEEEEEEEGETETTGGGQKVTKQKSSKKKKVVRRAEVQICTERDHLPRAPLPSKESGVQTFTVLSWNVNGLRAAVKNGLEALRRMVKAEGPDLICLQETKLQEKDVEGLLAMDILPGYDSAWTCSTVKKGYAGQAVFFPRQAEEWAGGKRGDKLSTATDGPPAKKRKQAKMSVFFTSKEPTPAPPIKATVSGGEDGPSSSTVSAVSGRRNGPKVLSVRFGIGNAKHDGEGRSITVEYDKFFVLTLYVPNSGQKLERLSYRTKDWDPALRSYVDKLEGEGKPVIVTGDLNVGHLDKDIYNAGAKHIGKTAGTTKEERASFDAWMSEGKVVDAFRRLHPDARGAYTYWSVRTNARPVNRGLRLDYFLCSRSMFADGGDNARGTPRSEAADHKNTPEKSLAKKQKQKEENEASPAVVVHDCFQLEKTTVGVSDHCPIGLVLRLG